MSILNWFEVLKKFIVIDASTSREDGWRIIERLYGILFAVVFLGIISGTVMPVWSPFFSEYLQIVSLFFPNIPPDDKLLKLLPYIFIVIIGCIAGSFIGAFREWGISVWYKHLYGKRIAKDKQTGKKTKKTKEEKIVFYLFRRGTCLQACLDDAKRETPSCKWIKENLDMHKNEKEIRNDMWNRAKKIQWKNPGRPDFVYAAYFRNCKLQYLDTSCLLYSLVCGIVFLLNFSKFAYQKQLSNVSLTFIIIPFALIFISLFLQRLFKHASEGAAKTFLNAIDSGSENLDKESEKASSNGGINIQNSSIDINIASGGSTINNKNNGSMRKNKAPGANTEMDRTQGKS
jgi:uncharacterized membrane protein